jgi:hypothetical protein
MRQISEGQNAMVRLFILRVYRMELLLHALCFFWPRLEIGAGVAFGEFITRLLNPVLGAIAFFCHMKRGFVLFVVHCGVLSLLGLERFT